MGVNDGEVIGSTKILESGPDEEKFNLILVAEGYRSAQQQAFNDKCEEFLDTLESDLWFRHLKRAINVYRINVASDDSGLDDPDICSDGTGEERDTYFDARTCNGWPIAVRRLTSCNTLLVMQTCDGLVPGWDIAILLVNTDLPGDLLDGLRAGSGGGPVGIVTTGSSDWAMVTLHELGHSAFGLADEYAYWASCAETDHDHPPPGSEPFQPNVTRARWGAFNALASHRDQVKWGHLIHPDTPIPTQTNPTCGDCPSDENPFPTLYEIGLLEGAGYYHCDVYRPAPTCRMKNTSRDFCFVCVEAIHASLTPFIKEEPKVAADVEALDFGKICSGEEAVGTFKIANLGGLFGNVTVASDSELASVSWKSFGVKPGALFNEAGLIPGQMAEVTVRFGPAELPPDHLMIKKMVVVEVWVDGNLEIQIPVYVQICNVHARGELSATALDFGHVAVGLTMYRALRISNVGDCCAENLNVRLGSMTGQFALEADAGFEFALPPGASEDVYVTFTAVDPPNTSYDGEFTIETNDEFLSRVTIPLEAWVVAPTPVDSVLVIDRSASMLGPTGETGRWKILHAVDAAELYISLLRPEDRIGVVRFNQHSTEAEGDLLLNLVAAGEETYGAGRIAALTQLAVNADHLEPTGGTAIGAGILLGSQVLDGAASPNRALVVITDGLETTGKSIADVKSEVAAKSPTQRIFAVGLGLEQLSEAIVDIASVNSGFAAITGDLVGEKEFLLQKLYTQILSDVSDTAFARDPKYTLELAQKKAVTVFIGEVDLSADFIVVLRPEGAKYARAWLEAPNGKLIKPEDADNFPGMRYVTRLASQYFRLPFPLFPQDTQGHLGAWKVWVENTATEPDTTGAPQVVFAVMARAYSNLRCSGWVEQPDHSPGTPIRFYIRPSLYGLPAAAMSPVIAQITRPSGSLQPVTLEPDGDYTYHGVIENTQDPGIYHIHCDIGVITPSGLPVSRTRYLNAFILPPGKDKPEEPPAKPPFILVAVALGSILFDRLSGWLRRCN
jgi:hypothetical protein